MLTGQEKQKREQAELKALAAKGESSLMDISSCMRARMHASVMEMETSMR